MNQPIAAIEAEKLLIGSVLQNGALLLEVRAALLSKDFFDGQMRRIYALLCEMEDFGREVHLNAFLQYLTDRKLEGDMLVAVALDCADKALRRASVAEYIAAILEKSQKREIYRLGFELTERAYSEQESAKDLIADADRKLLEIADQTQGSEETLEQQSYDALSKIDAERRGESIPSIRTGIPMLDMLTGGLGVGELNIVAGRPSMGKSCSVIQTAVTNCPAGTFVHIISPEMTSDWLLRRIAAGISGVSFGRIVNPQSLSDDDLARVRKAMMDVSRWPLLIDDAATVTPDQVLARARLIKRRHDTKVLAVDYLQLLTFPGGRQNLSVEVGDTAKRLAGFAKAEQVAVMLLSSLTEKTGSGANTPPSLHDLRQSGDIQYHARRAYLVHRERDEQTAVIKPETKFIVAKNHHGKTGAVDAMFNPRSLLFDDIEGASHVM
jgi:replicative DNA helicase